MRILSGKTGWAAGGLHRPAERLRLADTTDMTIGYAENGAPDYGANQMYQYVKERRRSGRGLRRYGLSAGDPGLMLWKEGHAGVYIGGGYAIEAMGTQYGVVKTEVDARLEGLGESCPSLEYREGLSKCASRRSCVFLRLKYKISLMELAKQGGLSNQQISHMELGRHTEDQAQGAAAAALDR